MGAGFLPKRMLSQHGVLEWWIAVHRLSEADLFSGKFFLHADSSPHHSTTPILLFPTFTLASASAHASMAAP